MRTREKTEVCKPRAGAPEKDHPPVAWISTTGLWGWEKVSLLVSPLPLLYFVTAASAQAKVKTWAFGVKEFWRGAIWVNRRDLDIFTLPEDSVK